jgi:hypothetical protein
MSGNASLTDVLLALSAPIALTLVLAPVTLFLYRRR